MNLSSQYLYLAGQIGLGLLLLAVAWAVGRLLDRRHLRRLDRREMELADIPCHQIKPPPGAAGGEAFLVCGSVVMGCDYFKLYVGRIFNLVGGNIDIFEGVLQRARREAQVRMIEQARAQGARTVWNMRLESAALGSPRGGLTVEVLCYGTALK
jgi:uncharacterized protein YbjQ (UPF0145 family)